MMVCMAKGCDETATSQAHMTLFITSPGHHGNYPVPGVFEIYCCDGCATLDMGRSILNDNDDVKQELEAQLEAAGNSKPNWHQSHVVWARLPQPIPTH